MKPLIDTKSIKTLKYSDYKKALKRDRKWLPKGQALIFLGQYRFADNKKGLGVLLFKKLAEAKQVFKALKTSGIPTPKIAIGTYQLTQQNGKSALGISLLRGGLTMEKIQTSGKTLFGPLWQVDLTTSEGEPNTAQKSGAMGEDSTRRSTPQKPSHTSGMGGTESTNTGMTGMEAKEPLDSQTYQAFKNYQSSDYHQAIKSAHPRAYQCALQEVKGWLEALQAEAKTAPKDQQMVYRTWIKEVHSFGLQIKEDAQKGVTAINNQKTQLQDMAKAYLVYGKRYKKSSSESERHAAWKKLQLMQQELKGIEPAPQTQKAHDQLSMKVTALLGSPQSVESTTKTVDLKAIEALKEEIMSLLQLHSNNKYQLQKAS